MRNLLVIIGPRGWREAPANSAREAHILHAHIAAQYHFGAVRHNICCSAQLTGVSLLRGFPGKGQEWLAQ